MVTQCVYDSWNPVQELDGSNAAVANLLTGLGIDERFTRTDANGATSFLTDALGSTIGLVNAGGAIATSYTYDPFGATTVGGSANANPYQFTGRENDGSGLYYYRARYYSPTFQRFISQDPLGFASGDANLYVYVYDDPTNLLDPFGLYGTSSCSYYTQDCNANGGSYYCSIAPGVCNNAGNSQWGRCVRQCPQEQNLGQLPEQNTCSSNNQESLPNLTEDHLFCWTACAENSQNPYNPGGPPLPDQNPFLYWPPASQ
ncbi:MAG: RHS repeat-associated core domain-containing protein [Candidatus Binataceae bacterium]|nr:RHS repeat-associated core domain-containing protein [Candidatus Binataceae bacterium]